MRTLQQKTYKGKPSHWWIERATLYHYETNSSYALIARDDNFDPVHIKFTGWDTLLVEPTFDLKGARELPLTPTAHTLKLEITMKHEAYLKDRKNGK